MPPESETRTVNGRMPSVPATEIDRLNIEQALRDFEVANARVVDLTSRLTAMNERALNLQHELSSVRLEAARVHDLNRQLDHVIFERDAARQETIDVRSSRSYKLGSVLVKVGRRLLP